MDNFRTGLHSSVRAGVKTFLALGAVYFDQRLGVCTLQMLVKICNFPIFHKFLQDFDAKITKKRLYLMFLSCYFCIHFGKNYTMLLAINWHSDKW